LTGAGKPRARWPLRTIQIVFAAGLLAILWQVADGREAARLLAGAEVSWLAAAVAALTLQTILSALRWRLTASRLGIEVSARTAIREYYLSQVINQSLPGGMIGDAGRAVRSRAQAGLARAGLAVVLERFAGQLAMFVVLATAFLFTLAAPGGLEWPRWVAVPVMIAIACAAAAPGLVWLAARLPGAVGRAVSSARDVMITALVANGALVRQVLLSCGTAACNLAAFAFCARAIGIDLPLAAIAALVPLVLFAMLIPLSVSGWGLREGAASALLPIAGTTAAEGFATSVAFGLTFIVAVLPGVLALLRRSALETARG
jgi:uncharacterized membrane protein YbhN (UPF0104 family)